MRDDKAKMGRNEGKRRRSMQIFLSVLAVSLMAPLLLTLKSAPLPVILHGKRQLVLRKHESEFSRESAIGKFSAVRTWDLPMLSELHSSLTRHAFENLRSEKYIEGHSGQVFPQTSIYFTMAKRVQPSVICEVGFNAGHSAATFLSASLGGAYYGFDNKEHEYASSSFVFLQNIFPGRMNITWGNSKDTLHKFFKPDNPLRCNLIHVDGGHWGDLPQEDLKMFKRVAAPGHLVMMDDVGCDEVYCDGPTKAWKKAIKEGWLNQIACLRSAVQLSNRKTSKADRGVCFGQFKGG